MKKTVIALALALAAGAAQAEFYTARQLYERINGDAGDGLFAMGFVAGVYDVNVGVQICHRIQGLRLGTVYAIVTNYINTRPDTWNRDAYAVVTEALQIGLGRCTRQSAPVPPPAPGTGV